MTREEAIEFIAQSVKSDIDMVLVADAIKALEQEPILDKIRAEIEKEADTSNRLAGISEIGLRKALKIIDKYKTESEVDNGNVD